MTPAAFIEKWSRSSLNERAAAQSHFIDLCHLLGEPTPTEADNKGTWYAFERSARKTTERRGWADVWKDRTFAWEYKRPGRSLATAYAQLQQYAPALGNPPLLIVSDTRDIVVHTNWTNSVSIKHLIRLRDLRDPVARQTLKSALSEPEKLRPEQTREALTEQTARHFSELATALRERGHAPDRVAHFVSRLVFCMFAQGVGLLKEGLFTKLMETSSERPQDFGELARDLFGAMRMGGRIGFERVRWFNGGLFDDDTALPLLPDEIQSVLDVSRKSWADIDPSIFGTLFERGLDPDKRAQLGKFYTDRGKIDMIVDPVIVQPHRDDWNRAKEEIRAAVAKATRASSDRVKREAMNRAQNVYKAALDRVRSFKVLDPACGSGNFLYVALLALKDIEHEIGIEAEAISPQLLREMPRVGPENLYGIEINSYAADLARVTIWIGEIQWMLKRGWNIPNNPVLRHLNTIECRDALLAADGSKAAWPQVDVVISNPPFLGNKLMLTMLDERYVRALRKAYQDDVPASADLVCYWIAKSWTAIKAGSISRAGLVATNSIRGGANRVILDAISETGVIFAARSDEPWVQDGAAVRVSIVAFADGKATDLPAPTLDGRVANVIRPDLTADGADLTNALPLAENMGTSFMGTTKGGAFDIAGKIARLMIEAPSNPNGRPNADVVRPWVNGLDVARRNRDMWIIDFGPDMTEEAAALYEKPFQHVEQAVKTERLKNRREAYARYWWRFVEPRSGMRRALHPLARYIATPRVAKHRIFVWLDRAVCPDCQLIVVARDDDTTFGILNSRFHQIWSLRLCTWLGVGNDPRYTPSTTFETFPFPKGMAPSAWAKSYEHIPQARAIAAAAKRLQELRERWLNPPDLVRQVPEATAGSPDRLLPVDERAAAILKSRTLTNLYNDRPTWLDDAHRVLDGAVAAAYGWPVEIADDEAIARLLDLNRERAIDHPSRVRPRHPDMQRTLLLPVSGDEPTPKAPESARPKKRAAVSRRPRSR